MQCVNLDQILDQEKKKKSRKDNWQKLNLDCGLDDSILSMLDFPILTIMLSKLQNILVFIKYTLTYLGVKEYNAYIF